MMLAATDKLDLSSVTPDGRWRLLLVVEAGEWSLPDARTLLQEKVNGYASYALDGQLHREHPEAADAQVAIVICPVDPVPPEMASFIEQIAAALRPEGLPVTIERLPAHAAA